MSSHTSQPKFSIEAVPSFCSVPPHLSITVQVSDLSQMELCMKRMAAIDQIHHTGDGMGGGFHVYADTLSADAAIALFKDLQEKGFSFENPTQVLTTIRTEGDKMIAMQPGARK